ncbi:asparagine synthase (glutamine-hydrolyzing) [Salinisphaera sp. LB1]|uniref:asparagine synthase (glutamine-hydrolyzing) n=1 Tax=Salinisphaera sp. LB1 TaxID=2183911 RepID=UPI000D707788|nr:asparagine synthase (glutamine-hydrolyzing) [Salinisphaera sp. LB1]
MCGISGLWQQRSRSGDKSLEQCALQMADRLQHRGPDDFGVWADHDRGLALSHRRLSIIDLSPQGHQPMVSACGRYVVVFNGEIYNFLEIKKDLESRAYPFKGHSDTEVLLAAVSIWGVAAAVQRFNGMFAIAIWDREQRQLHLVRDRLGQKPLFFGWIGGGFAFASELKALRVVPGFSGRLDRRAIGRYLQSGYVPSPDCIYEGVHKLPAGHILSIDETQASEPTDLRTLQTPYWSVADYAQNAIRKPFQGTAEEAVDALNIELQKATASRMISDVSLGAFLSGGIDSSLIVALMQAQSQTPIKSYALGFGEHGAGETAYAKAIADHLGTEHTELHITGQEAIDTVPNIPQIVDEPMADFAQVPNYLIAKHARPHIKVALTGDGGDEFFCGYSRFYRTPKRWHRLQRLPLPVRRLMARAQAKMLRSDDVRDRKGTSLLRLQASSLDELYFYGMCHWLPSDPLLADGAIEIDSQVTDARRWSGIRNPIERLLLIDQIYYLCDVILTKVDRTSMASGLEVRSPLLDYHVAQWSWHLPLDMKFRDGKGKWILRELLARYMPRELYERPKQGFGAPIGQWLSGPLREWAEDLLSAERLHRQGLLNPGMVRRVWQAQRVESRAWQKKMWCILMLQAWLNAEQA